MRKQKMKVKMLHPQNTLYKDKIPWIWKRGHFNEGSAENLVYGK